MIDKYLHNWIMPDASGVLLVVASWGPKLLSVDSNTLGNGFAVLLSVIVSLLAITDFTMKIYWKLKQAKKNKEKRKKGDHEEPDGH